MCFRPTSVEAGPIACPQCRKEVLNAATATKCPHCGAKVQNGPGGAPGAPPIPGAPGAPGASKLS